VAVKEILHKRKWGFVELLYGSIYRQGRI